MLYLTDFSRACASQWLLEHGRRFTCSRTERKDKGIPKQKRTFTQSDLAVQMRARSAHDVLYKIAEEDATSRDPVERLTIVQGCNRASIMASVNRMTPVINKKTLKFRDRTESKLREKRQAKKSPWAGLAGDLVPRLGGAAAIVHARSRTKNAQVVGALHWRGRAARARHTALASGPSTGETKLATRCASSPAVLGQNRGLASSSGGASLPAGDAVRGPCPHSCKTATCTLDDMFRQKMADPNSKDLLVWLSAVFNGESVLCDGKAFSFKPSRRIPTTISLDDAFSSKHSALSKALSRLAAETDSRWSVLVKSDEVHRSAQVVAKKRDLVEVLLNVRRAAGEPSLAH